MSFSLIQLRRLAGVKRGRKREEGLNNITEIREDDVKEGIKNFQKYHTEDSVSKYYQVEAVSGLFSLLSMYLLQLPLLSFISPSYKLPLVSRKGNTSYLF